jgi:hypothetical protein
MAISGDSHHFSIQARFFSNSWDSR